MHNVSYQPREARRQARALLESEQAPEGLIATFCEQIEQVAGKGEPWLRGRDLRPVEPLPDGQAAGAEAAGREALPQTVVCKLNGGLGTSMGLEKAKSLLPVRDGLTFLALAAQQVLALRKRHDVPLPLLLMNSFATDRDSLDALEKLPELARGQAGIPLRFLQHRVPKLDAETLLPMASPAQPELAWCPPGHGEFYTALHAGGLLERLIAKGFRYAFVSNIDNLGAVLDVGLLGYFVRKGYPFMMEAALRTPADRKGGHLARRQDGRLILREKAQCPDDEMADFQDIERHRYFNTNSLWLDLQALQRSLQQRGGRLDLPLIINRKTLDPRDAASPPVLQLETAMGAAIQGFESAAAVCVPRSRFAPVKTTEDLLAVRSDAYRLDHGKALRLAPERQGMPPLIALDPAYYRSVDDFETRFPQGPPSLKHCRKLTVRGDVRFEKGVRVRGCVRLRNTAAEPFVVAAGSVLEDTDLER